MAILVYGNFIRVWWEKEAAIQGSCMKQLFLCNSSHEGMCAYSNSIRKCKLKISQHPSQCYCQLPQNSSRKPVGRFDKRNSLTISFGLQVFGLCYRWSSQSYQDTKEPTPLTAEAFDIRVGRHESFRTLRQRAIRESIGFEVIEHSSFPRSDGNNYITVINPMIPIII